MSLLSSPYLPARISLSSKTGLNGGVVSETQDVMCSSEEYRRVYGDCAVTLEYRGDSLENLVSNDHVFSVPWED